MDCLLIRCAIQHRQYPSNLVTHIACLFDKSQELVKSARSEFNITSSKVQECSPNDWAVWNCTSSAVVSQLRFAGHIYGRYSICFDDLWGCTLDGNQRCNFVNLIDIAFATQRPSIHPRFTPLSWKPCPFRFPGPSLPCSEMSSLDRKPGFHFANIINIAFATKDKIFTQGSHLSWQLTPDIAFATQRQGIHRRFTHLSENPAISDL